MPWGRFRKHPSLFVGRGDSIARTPPAHTRRERPAPMAGRAPGFPPSGRPISSRRVAHPPGAAKTYSGFGSVVVERWRTRIAPQNLGVPPPHRLGTAGSFVATTAQRPPAGSGARWRPLSWSSLPSSSSRSRRSPRGRSRLHVSSHPPHRRFRQVRPRVSSGGPPVASGRPGPRWNVRWIECGPRV